jgi:ABC-type antimicrobial peptide transport system permease subunit
MDGVVPVSQSMALLVVFVGPSFKRGQPNSAGRVSTARRVELICCLRFEIVDRTICLRANPRSTAPVRAAAEAYLADTLSTRRFSLTLLGVFGALALLLAAVGIYGVISYAVSLRAREVGIRMAIGADRRQILSMVLGQALRLCSAGLVSGALAAFALTRFLKDGLGFGGLRPSVSDYR